MLKRIIILSILLLSARVFAQQLKTDHSMKSSIRFIADATFGNFEGTTGAVYGSIYLKNNNIASGDSVVFYLYLDSLDTGIGLRNEHMRNNYLDTKDYPFVYYRGKIASVDSTSLLESNVVVKGKFRLHGISRTKEIEGKFYNYGRIYKIISSFNVSLSNYDIKQPSFLFNTVKNTIYVDAIIYLKHEKQ